MYWQIDLIIIVLFITSIIAAVLAGMAWRRRTTIGGRQLSGLMLGVAIWAFTTALEFTSPSINTRILISGFQYFGIATVPVSYLSFALAFSGYTRWRTRRNLILMWTIPAITIILAFTNQYHHLIWTSFTPQPLGASFLVVYGHGIGLWIATIYFYLCLLVGLLLVIRHTFIQKGIYRSQGIMVLIGLVIPWIGNIAYMFGFSPIPGLDFAPITSTISGLVLILAVLQFRLLDLIPIARNAVIDLMQDGVIVLDTQSRLVDINPAACALLNKKQSEVLGLSINEVYSPWSKLVEQHIDTDEIQEEIALPEPYNKVLDLRVTTIRDKHDLPGGHLIVLRDISQRKQIEGRLATSESRLRRITDNMLDVINETDGDIKITYVSPSVKELLGYSPEELIGNQFYDFIHPEDRSEVDEAILEAISNPDEKLALTQEFRLKHLQKGYIWVEAVTRFLFDAEGNIERSITVSRDITERKSIQDAETKARKMAVALQAAGIALSSSLQFDQVLKMILEQAAQVVSLDSASVLLLEDNDLVIMNTLGFPDGEKLIGNRITITGNNPNKTVIKKREPFIVDDIRGKYEGFEMPHLARIHSWMGIPLQYQNRIIGVLAFHGHQVNHFTKDDASIASAFATPVAMAIENSRLYSQMEQLATTDMLTGLSNRRDFFIKAEIELERARRYTRSLALIMVDIDHFKTTNDTYGHQAGDQVLRTLAVECFQTVLRKIDIAGRYGGEEFILLLPETSREDAILAAERLRGLVENTICHTTAADIRVTISLGVATLNPKNNRLQNLVEDADKALYLAKKNGRNRVEIFEQEDVAG